MCIFFFPTYFTFEPTKGTLVYPQSCKMTEENVSTVKVSKKRKQPGSVLSISEQVHEDKEIKEMFPGRNAYQLFCKKSRPKIVKEYPEEPFSQIAAKLGHLWRDSDKNRWEKKYAHQMIDYWWACADKLEELRNKQEVKDNGENVEPVEPKPNGSKRESKEKESKDREAKESKEKDKEPKGKEPNLYAKYFTRVNEQEVNVDNEVKNTVECRLQSPDCHIFDEAKMVIRNWISVTVLPSFQRTPECKTVFELEEVKSKLGEEQHTLRELHSKIEACQQLISDLKRKEEKLEESVAQIVEQQKLGGKKKAGIFRKPHFFSS